MRSLKGLWPALAIVLASEILGGCGVRRSADQEPKVLSDDHLKAGLSAMTAGDDQLAERELVTSLEMDGDNTKAMTALASVYSKRAGIDLLEWLDVFIDAARRFESRAREIEKTAALMTALNSEAERIASEVKGKLEEEDSSLREAFGKIIHPISRVALAVSAVSDIFEKTPHLTSDQLVTLDRAIDILRSGSLAPAERPEEVRIYLSLLSAIRLVNHAKRLLGTDLSQLPELLGSREKLCAVDRQRIFEELYELRKSAGRMQEGLIVAPQDPQTSQRFAREKLATALQKVLDSEVLEKVEDLLRGDTPEALVVGRAMKSVCESVTTDKP